MTQRKRFGSDDVIISTNTCFADLNLVSWRGWYNWRYVGQSVQSSKESTLKNKIFFCSKTYVLFKRPWTFIDLHSYIFSRQGSWRSLIKRLSLKLYDIVAGFWQHESFQTTNGIQLSFLSCFWIFDSLNTIVRSIQETTQMKVTVICHTEAVHENIFVPSKVLKANGILN